MSRILCDIVYLFKPLSASAKAGVSYVHVHKLTILRLKSDKRPKTFNFKGLAKTCQSCSYTSRPQSVVLLKKSFQNMESAGRALRKDMFFRESNTRPATISYSVPEVFLFSQEVVFSPILFAIHIIWGPVSKTSLKQNFLAFFKLFPTYCEQLRPSQSGCRGNGGHQEISGNVFIPRVSRKCLCFRMRKTPLALATNL